MTLRKPLRILPAVVIAVAQALVMFLGPIVAPDAPLPVGMIGGLIGAMAILVWWLFFSRARWSERIGAILLIVLGVLATRLVVHESIAGAGQGMFIYILPIPYLALALTVWAAATYRMRDHVRRALFVVVILLTLTPFVLIRTAGVRGGAGADFHWRWTPTPEERLLAQANDEPREIARSTAADVVAPVPSAPPAAPVAETPKETAAAKPEEARTAAPKSEVSAATPAPAAVDPPARDTAAEWPGFRGPNRDSIIRGVRINADWSARPPVQIWRRPIGPGWSSFAVDGDLLYTQEQRGDEEVVACYRVSTGDPVWKHRDAVRFYESNGGAGPRGTPTLSNGRVYAFGATGILNALDARTGALLWSHDVSAESKVKTPYWGFTSSPLVVDDLVIVSASGAVAAYDGATGTQRWINPSRGGSYSSPHLATIDGVRQVLLLGGPGVLSVAPADGTPLWEHAWDGGAIVQPAVIDDSDVLINAMSMTGGVGTRRLHVRRDAGSWKVEERWTSNGLKPYFNDFVVHEGHAYGFDNSIMASIDLVDGRRKWKGGRYGNGQLVLLPEQDLLLVISEDGDLALVSATPDGFREIARFKVFDAKTWNHPVLVGEVLLVRNGEEMAAFRLAPEAGTTR